MEDNSVLKFISNEWGVDWTRLVQDRDQWQAFVNEMMKFRDHEKRYILIDQQSDDITSKLPR
jgi:hypothetical protein